MDETNTNRRARLDRQLERGILTQREREREHEMAVRDLSMAAASSPLLVVEGFRHYGWQAASDAPGAYLDSASFNYVHVLVIGDGMSGTTKATVLFAGSPVLLVWWTGSDYEYESPVTYSPEHVSAYVHFLVQIGEADENADEWQAEHPDESVWTTEHVGDGHELIACVGHVVRALHAAYPDECGEPMGF